MAILRTVFLRLALIALLAVGLSIASAAVFGAVALAAYFAFGAETPAFPWFLLRFFLCLGWIIAIPLSLSIPLPTPPAPAIRGDEK